MAIGGIERARQARPGPLKAAERLGGDPHSALIVAVTLGDQRGQPRSDAPDDQGVVAHHRFGIGGALFDLVLDVLILAVDALQELFDHELEAPFISALLHMAGIDSTLTMKHVMGLVGAYPATLLKGVVNGGSLFPGDAASSAAAQADSVDDPWACALAWVSSAVQIAWTFVDIYEDAKIGDASQGAPSWTTWVDILSPIALMLFNWPNAKFNGLTVPFWESEIDFSAPGGGTSLRCCWPTCCRRYAGSRPSNRTPTPTPRPTTATTAWSSVGPRMTQGL